MERKTFADVLANAGIDLSREYERIYILYIEKDTDGLSWRKVCERHFYEMPFKDTYLSLQDLEVCCGIRFSFPPDSFDLYYLISFCEYFYNLIIHCKSDSHFNRSNFPNPIQHIETLIDKLNYKIIHSDQIYLFVPRSQPAIVVSEMLPPDLSYKVIEYNHHSMKGNLERKQATLKLLADQLEAKRADLNSVDKTLTSDLFFLINTLNIRHNNVDPKSNSYKKAVADMPDDELEEWYDRTYDMCLYAFMTLELADSKTKIKEIKERI